MMKMPSDISADFQGSWEAFLELPQTSKLEPLVLGECFRILLQQAGIKVQTMKSLSDFFTVNTRYQSFNKQLHSKFLLYHLMPVQHKYEFVFNANDLTNVVSGFSIQGTVKLKPQRFDLDYLLRRLVELKTFKEIPPELKLTSRTTSRDGSPVTIYKDKFPTSLNRVRPTQEVLVIGNKEMRVKVARLKGDFLVLKYELYFDNIIPMYPNLEKQLFAVWRRATIGDFR